MLQVKESKDLISSFFEMDLFSDETKQRVRDADILLLPDIGVFDDIQKAFRPDTKTFLKYIRANNTSNYKIEMFENAGEETVLNFHSHDIYLPVIYLRGGKLVPDTIALVIGYVENKMKHGRNNEPVINFILKVEEAGICKVYNYKGFIDELRESYEGGEWGR